MINLSPEGEPQIYNAIRFGTVLENVVYDPETREVDYADAPSRRTPAPPTPSSSSTTPGFPAWAATRAISSFWPTMPSVYCRRWPA
nr:phosphoenolpyruvate carboxykinase (ATP) [Rhodothermus marinus]